MRGGSLPTCLDTSFLFDLLAGIPEASAAAASLDPPIFMSALSFYELLAGETNRRRIQQVNRLARDFAVVPVSFEVCSLASEMQTRLKGQGEPIPDFDALLAATSFLIGARFVTADWHFHRVAREFGLQLYEYRLDGAAN